MSFTAPALCPCFYGGTASASGGKGQQVVPRAMPTNIRPRTESLRAPCSPSDPSPYPWVCLMHQKPCTGICKSFPGYPREGSVPASGVSAGVVGSMNLAATRSAQHLAISSTSAPDRSHKDRLMPIPNSSSVP